MQSFEGNLQDIQPENGLNWRILPERCMTTGTTMAEVGISRQMANYFLSQIFQFCDFYSTLMAFKYA